MAEARKCDICGEMSEWPFSGWLYVEEMGHARRRGERTRWDVCSTACLQTLAESMHGGDMGPEGQARRPIASEGLGVLETDSG